MPEFRLEGIKYDPKFNQTRNMLYSKNHYNPKKVKLENWYMGIENEPIDSDPCNPECFNLHNSHYRRLGTSNETFYVSETQEAFNRDLNRSQALKQDPHKYLINVITYRVDCNGKTNGQCLNNDYYRTTMQTSYSSPFPYVMKRLEMPKTGCENKKLAAQNQCKFLDDDFLSFTRSLQQTKGHRYKKIIDLF
ncbi:hypothetical protein ABEB36_011828 [Hypothenemus hampei]|uniref:Spaetzle domain-containing protein n=1 Tax=Hypothenemus hampei TaxID=57062 RepID=A0ABD1E9Z4_HYPHA